MPFATSAAMRTGVSVMTSTLSSRRTRQSSAYARRYAVASSVDDVATTTKADVEATKMALLSIAAASARGEGATSSQKDEARAVIDKLCAMNAVAEPAYSAMMDGDWELVYTDTFPFRSSPFFWGVGKLLGDNAGFFYSAHEHQTSMFGGGCGKVVQSIDMNAGKITSDVIVRASIGVPLLGFSPLFAGFGSVITSGEANPFGGDSIAVPISSLSTTVRQDDASVLPALNFLNGSTVPVGDIMGRVADGSSEVLMTTRYLDENFRVSTLEDDSVLVYRRV